ncbi:arylamine N-acetyltransferase [Prauserella oleivorans]
MARGARARHPVREHRPAARPLPSLAIGDIADKLVHRRRGGYCYEHNLLLAAALEQLGYDVVRQTARVQPDSGGPRTHMNLRVHVDGTDYLADTGFGAGIMHPMPLRTGTEFDQAGWRYRLSADEGGLRLEKFTDGEWRAEYSFGPEPQQPIDYEVANHYVATHPRSPFTGRIVVMRLSDGVCRKLIGKHLVAEHPDGSREHTVIGPDDLAGALRSSICTSTPPTCTSSASATPVRARPRHDQPRAERISVPGPAAGAVYFGPCRPSGSPPRETGGA